MTYHLIMQCGTEPSLEFDCCAPDAAQAMSIALEKRRGHVIRECWAGHKDWPEMGYTVYDIPPHRALPPLPPKEKKPKKEGAVS